MERLGAFVTGSGTSTCVLFGGLQSQTALSLGLNPSWMAAAKCYGSRHWKDDLSTGYRDWSRCDRCSWF
ncbi:MAG: L-lactate permease [Anaerobutyricum sp.]